MRHESGAASACEQGTKAGQKSQKSSQQESQVASAPISKRLILLATPAGFEPATFSLEGRLESIEFQRHLRLFLCPKSFFWGES
jgi:hypothetical protein